MVIGFQAEEVSLLEKGCSGEYYAQNFTPMEDLMGIYHSNGRI